MSTIFVASDAQERVANHGDIAKMIWFLQTITHNAIQAINEKPNSVLMMYLGGSPTQRLLYEYGTGKLTLFDGVYSGMVIVPQCTSPEVCREDCGCGCWIDRGWQRASVCEWEEITQRHCHESTRRVAQE